jgi:hypothetical protein
MNKKFTLLFFLSFLICMAASAQVEKILDPTAGFLDDLIVGDTATDGSRVETTYVLQRDANYYVQGQFSNYGWKLIIKAEDGTGARPVVTPYPQADGTNYSHMIYSYGDIDLENIYFDCQSLAPNEAIQPAGRVLISGYEGAKIDINGCAFVNCGQNGVMLPKATDYVKMNNCQFLNMGKFSFFDYGNGRVFDCRDSEINLFSLTNCTITNIVDRLIRHRSGSGVMREIVLDHNTIINGMNYHGFLELGNVGTSVQITNNLMVDCMGLGNDSTDLTRLSELDAHGEVDGAGNPRMVWVGSIPNDTTSYRIHHNYYNVTDEQQAWYTSTGFVDEGPKWLLTEHIKSKLSAEDLATAWVKQDFTLPNIPATPVDFYEYYWSPDGSNKQKETTLMVDYDSKNMDYWLNSFDCMLTAEGNWGEGSDGVTVGDPNWGSITVGIPQIRYDDVEMVGYPNPVVDKLTLRFNLEASSSVSVDIYDITGDKVRSINDNYFSAGKNSMEIDRGNLNSGIYILKLNTGTSNGVMKITVN